MSRADYVEETTSSIAGSNGDGAITLTALTGIPRFSTVFGASARMVEYTIEDTVLKKFETGLGSVSGNVLTRTTPRVTWDGTTYLASTPAPLQFTSAPTLGNVRIRMAAVANSFMAPPPAIQKTVGADVWLGYQHSQHLNSVSVAGSAGITADREYYIPYYSTCQGKLDAFVVDIGVAGTTGVKLGLYEVGADGLPGQAITTSNVISSATSGFKVDSANGTWGVNTGPQRLGVGWYYLGFICGDATVQVKRWQGQTASAHIMNTMLGRDIYGIIAGIFRTGSYATGMPTGVPAGGYTTDAFNDWCVGMRASN